MSTYAFRIVNVFAESPLAGNPLCVFEDARGLDAATMQALALQFNLSETTFVLPSQRATAHVRIFTPTFEMPFAGHPTLGTAHVVRDLAGAGDARDARDEGRASFRSPPPATSGRCRPTRRGTARRPPRPPTWRRCSASPPSDIAEHAAVGRHGVRAARDSARDRRRRAPRCADGAGAARARQQRAARDGLRVRPRRRSRARAVLLPQARVRRRGSRAPGRRAPTWAAGCSRPARRCRSGSSSTRARPSTARAGSASKSPPTGRSGCPDAWSRSRAAP